MSATYYRCPTHDLHYPEGESCPKCDGKYTNTVYSMSYFDDLRARMLKRAEIRRNIPRGEPDRISDILEEAAKAIEHLQEYKWMYEDLNK